MSGTIDGHVIQLLLPGIVIAKVAHVLDHLNGDAITDAAGISGLRPGLTLTALWGEWGGGVNNTQ